jgi:uncharacterized delta-60 repeat protein
MRTIFSLAAFRPIWMGSTLCATLFGCGAPDSSVAEPVRAGSSESAFSPSGSLDSQFGHGGTVSGGFRPAGALNVALQPDGKFVVVSPLSDFDVAAQVFGVVRYLPNGSIDATFGNQGVVRTAFTVGFNVPTSAAIAPDASIVVAGSASSPDNATTSFAAARYRSNGSLDRSFGNGGLVTTALLGKRDEANVVLVQPDGKILVGGKALTAFGRAGINDTALVRYNGDGRLDASFGQGGKVVVDAAGSVTVLALEPDASILVMGVDRTGNTSAARFSSTGTRLPLALAGRLASVATTGKATFQSDGAFLVATAAPGKSRFDVDIRVARFLLSGGADTTFASVPFDFASPGVPNRPNAAQALLVEPNGKILVGGIAGVDLGVSAFGLARLNADGSFDATFGNRGIVTTQFSGRSDQIFALARQPDGKILAVGSTIDASTGETSIALARYVGP